MSRLGELVVVGLALRVGECAQDTLVEGAERRSIRPRLHVLYLELDDLALIHVVDGRALVADDSGEGVEEAPVAHVVGGADELRVELVEDAHEYVPIAGGGRRRPVAKVSGDLGPDEVLGALRLRSGLNVEEVQQLEAIGPGQIGARGDFFVLVLSAVRVDLREDDGAQALELGADEVGVDTVHLTLFRCERGVRPCNGLAKGPAVGEGRQRPWRCDWLQSGWRTGCGLRWFRGEVGDLEYDLLYVEGDVALNTPQELVEVLDRGKVQLAVLLIEVCSVFEEYGLVILVAAE